SAIPIHRQPAWSFTKMTGGRVPALLFASMKAAVIGEAISGRIFNGLRGRIAWQGRRPAALVFFTKGFGVAGAAVVCRGNFVPLYLMLTLMVPILMVPRRGLEPPRLAALVPETSASTNSATWAFAAEGNAPPR